MDNDLRICEDGSHTLFSALVGECYHSMHGAYTESMHIFINAGFRYILEIQSNLRSNLKTETIPQVRILEVGLGTGLNALLTILETEKENTPVSYLALEPFPIHSDIIQQLNYSAYISGNSTQFFEAIHSCDWNQIHQLFPNFSFRKMLTGFLEAKLISGSFDLIYFDAFSPEAQPDLWEPEVFVKCFELLDKDGILVTYCAKGRVKRALKAAGFTVENLPGPPRKREITRAHKLF